MLSVLEKVDLLRNAKLFQALPTQSLVRVAAIAHELTWAPQQVVYQEDSRAESILMVLEGEVELIRGGNVFAQSGRTSAGGLAALPSGDTPSRRWFRGRRAPCAWTGRSFSTPWRRISASREESSRPWPEWPTGTA